VPRASHRKLEPSEDVSCTCARGTHAKHGRPKNERRRRWQPCQKRHEIQKPQSTGIPRSWYASSRLGTYADTRRERSLESKLLKIEKDSVIELNSPPRRKARDERRKRVKRKRLSFLLSGF